MRDGKSLRVQIHLFTASNMDISSEEVLGG